MYFPYFRGRQYELLALRDLSRDGLIGESVVPVIEPVKLMSTLGSTLEFYVDRNLPIGLVFNPTVGDLAKDAQSILPLYDWLSSDVIIPSVIINRATPTCLDRLERTHSVNRNEVLSVLDNRDYLNIFAKEFFGITSRFTLFPDDRQIRRAVSDNKVLFEDKFLKRPKNADYVKDEFFSDDHLYYTEEGYIGFGDYSIVGKDYNDSGWAPYAVVLHIVYFAADKTLRIKHFVSDSNEDTFDVAGKFYEAVSKLAEWYQVCPEWQTTIGLQTFISHFKNGTYPGLPTLKKLSIMHHLELMGKYLDGKCQ